MSDFGGPFGIRRLIIFAEVGEKTIRTGSALSSFTKDAELEVELSSPDVLFPAWLPSSEVGVRCLFGGLAPAAAHLHSHYLYFGHRA